MGGIALNGNKIKKEFVEPTYKKFSEMILNHIPNNGFCILGSAGKKSISSDIDVGIETNLTLEEISDYLTNLNIINKISKSFNQVYTLFPIWNQFEICPAEGNVQIDLMLGELDWLKFSYWSPNAEETEFTGHHRSVLLAAIIRYCRRIYATKTLVINWGPGIFEKTREKYIGRNGQEKEKITNKKFITNSPVVLLDILNNETKGNWTFENLFCSVEKLWEKTITVFDEPTIQAIKEYCRPAIQHRGIEYKIPKFME